MSEPAIDRELLQEELTAYLDGELDTESSRRIEELMARDPRVREMMAELDGAWRLLDTLDSAVVDDRFTRTTLEMAAQAAAEELKSEETAQPRRRRLALLGWAGGLLLAAGVGFVTAAMIRSDPDRELLEQLPIVENLDYYTVIDDVEFLRLLAEADLFTNEEHSSP